MKGVRCGLQVLQFRYWEQVEKYVEGKWIEVKPGDRFKLTKPDAQVFILQYFLYS